MRPTVTITPALLTQYRNGGEGFVKWVEDNVFMPIYSEGSDVSDWVPMGDLSSSPNPYTGRSYRSMWLRQLDHIVPALEMVNGRFRHRLLIFCWMRGEGKSAVACLIQLWKFFCWPKQQIVLGANSKDQTKFVHYDIIRDMIANSPNLLSFIGGHDNLQEKQITLRNPQSGTILSAIRSISSFSGIVSNITGYTFSEMFDMKSPKFFTQLDGSTRNVPNALGVIDSTVSDKSHVLYKMYENSVKKTIPELFFSYRSSVMGDADDFYHPQMTQAQLDAFKLKFPFGEFERYFKNLWEAGAVRFLSDAHIESMNYWGVFNQFGNYGALLERVNVLLEANRAVDSYAEVTDANGLAHTIAVSAVERRRSVLAEMVPVSRTISLVDQYNEQCSATIDDLQALSDLFDTHWSLHVGFDRADPMALGVTTRTVLTLTAKGLPGSRHGRGYEELSEPPYIYVLCGIYAYKEHTIEDIKTAIAQWHEQLDGVDTLCSERWGAWDLAQWGQELGIEVELVSPTYERQRTCFNELYTLITTGRYKVPPTIVPGSKETDIVKEELRMFTHDRVKKWFGSPEKEVLGGVQDDSVYAQGWGIFGSRNVNSSHFRIRGKSGMLHFGYTDPTNELLGSY